ncbi:MAG: type I restriction enzyme HsdR N-terminal domain-containing protein [Flavobacteriaceae bacterium]
MVPLNFPAFKFDIKNRENKPYIFDRIRKKWVVLQAEEWVRQHCIKYLIETKAYPISMLNVEKKIALNGLTRRYDIIVYLNTGKPFLLVECKAPNIIITQSSFDQIARYNYVLNSRFLMVSNGLDHYFCKMDTRQQQYTFLKELPPYSTDQ